MTATASTSAPAGNDVSVWCFAGAGLWTLTDDEAGAAFPGDLGPWMLRKRLTIDRTDPSEAEALVLIGKHGFCCFNPAPADAEA